MSQLSGMLGFEAVSPVVQVIALAMPAAVLLTLLAVWRGQTKAKRLARSKPVQAFDASQLFENPAPVASLLRDAPRDEQPSLANGIERLQARLTAASQSDLAPIYMEIAAQHRVSGDEAARLAALRSAAGLAAKHGPRAAHAQARLELAEVAFVAGDLTGACEQWQMARTALHDDGQRDAATRVDKRMLDNGCPTDWVLTDF
jgi:hypothetical protein